MFCLRLCVSVPTWKLLRSHHYSLTTGRTAEETKKINEFSWIHQRFEVREPTATLKSGETGNYKELRPRSAYQKQKALSHKLVGTHKW